MSPRQLVLTAFYAPTTDKLQDYSWDVLFGIAGLIAGSYLFAELSGWLKRTVETWGDKGKVMLPDLLHAPRLPFAIAMAVLLTAGLFFLHRAFPR